MHGKWPVAACYFVLWMDISIVAHTTTLPSLHTLQKSIIYWTQLPFMLGYDGLLSAELEAFACNTAHNNIGNSAENGTGSEFSMGLA